MDNINPPIMESPIESITPIKPPEKKQPPVLTIILFLVLVVTLIFLYLLFFTKVLDNVKILNPQDENSQEQEDPNEQGDETPDFVAYDGETFTAHLPTQWSISDWSIEEYYNGAGTDMLTDGETFTGLTGFKIFKNDVEMFYLKAIYGIGFAGCPNYARFADESTTYYNQIVADNQISGTQVNIDDFTAAEYSEFEWLGKTFRRVEREYNYDTVDGNNYFEPSCVPTLVTFDGLEFQPATGPAATSYDYGPTEDATLEDLEEIDLILESMELSN
ncbi:MAG: hypothetical protein RBS01_03970 [Candidatus Dojkabacteria bacterium]|jgi:hypothetical protein|nr:hypothetical protein [Candidatus Dojkabacteria bacterium]